MGEHAMPLPDFDMPDSWGSGAWSFDPCPATPPPSTVLLNCNSSNGSTLEQLSAVLNDTLQELASVNQRCAGLLNWSGDGRLRSVTIVGGPWDTLLEGTTLRMAQAAGWMGVGLALVGFFRFLFRSWPGLALPRPSQLAALCRGGKAPPAVLQKLLELRVCQLQGLLSAACYILMPFTAFSSRLAPYLLRKSLMLAVAQNILAIFAVYPGLVAPRSLDAVFCCMATLLALLVSPFASGEESLLLSLLLGNGLMMLLVAVRRTTAACLPLLPLAALLFAASSSCSIFVHGSFVFGHLQPLLAAVQVVVALCMAAVAPLLERESRAWMHQVMELEELQELLSACQSLLRSCFDVVVELDAEGNITSMGPELGALLLRQSAGGEGGRHMQGESFVGLLEGEGAKTAFQARLTAPIARGLGLAEGMQVSMRDACGNCLRLELMWFGFTRVGTAGKEQYFMLGLRETSDPVGEPVPQRELPHAQDSVPVAVSVPSAFGGSRMTVAVSETSSVPETQSVSSGSFIDAGAVVVVEPMDCTVLRVSGNFRARVGPLRRGRPLMESLRRPRDFKQWLRQALDLQLELGQAPPDRPVLFNMPQGRVRACCKVLRGNQEERGGLALLFFHITQVEEVEGRAVGMVRRGTSPKGSEGSEAGRSLQLAQPVARVTL